MLSSSPQLSTECGRGRDAKYAPIGGPIQKQMANAIPTYARPLDRLADVVTSDMIALLEA